MKILFLLPYNPYPPNNGNKTLTYNLLRSLSKEISIDIVIIEDFEVNYSLKKSNIKFFLPNIENIFIFKKLKNNKLIFQKIKLFLMGLHPTLAKFENKKLQNWLLINHKNYDIIHFDTILTVNYIKFIENKSTFLVASDAYSMATNRARNLTRNIYRYLRLTIQKNFYINIEKKIYPTFSKVVAVSPIDAIYLKKLSPNINISSLPIPIGEDLLNMKLKHFELIKNSPNKVRILFVGTLSHPIISDNIVSIIVLLKNNLLKYVDVEVVILGKEPNFNIKKILGVKVQHVEYVDDYEAFLDQDWIYVYAQKCASGLQTKLQKAMAIGLPIISRSVSLGGLEVIHKENILIAESDNEFVNNILILLRQPKLREFIGKNARKTILDQYSPDVVKEKYLITYKKLLNLA